MRKFMETVDTAEKHQIDEGIVDTFKDIVAKGETKTEIKKELRHIKRGWIKFSTANKLEDDDVEGFKKFLAHWNFDGNEIDEIIGDGVFNIDSSFDRAAQLQWNAGKGVTGADRGGPFKQTTTPKDDPASILAFFQKELGGNAAQLQVELAAVKNPEQLGNDPLAMLGYAFLKASGKGKK